MSFHFQHEGPASQVADKVHAEEVSGDYTQLDIVKRFIETHIARFPGHAHVTVTASGHHDGPVGTLNVTIGHTVAVAATTPPPAGEEQ